MKKDLYPWLLLTVTSLAVLLTGLNLSTLNVALPAISAHFQAGAVAASWTILSYMLFNTVLILVFGRLGDIYGRRNLFLFGFAVYTAACFLCGLAANVGVFILFRIFQAIGGALVTANTTPLITDAFIRGRLGLALGINAFFVAIAQLIGPVVGGYLVVVLGWQWIFWLNVPLGILCLVWGWLRLRPEPGRARGDKIDVKGNIAAVLGLGGLIYALSEGGVTGWVRAPVLAGILLFAVSAVFFFRHERRVPSPMIDLTMFNNRCYAMANLAAFLNSYTRAASLLMVSLYFQIVAQDNPLEAGLKTLPIAIGLSLSSPVVGLLSQKYSARFLSIVGLVGTCLGLGLLIWQIRGEVSVFWISVGGLLVGIGSGVFQTPNTMLIMTTVRAARRGVANGIRSMLQNMGKVFGTALSLLLVTYYLPYHLKNAVYEGTVGVLQPENIDLISQGFQASFWIMLFLTVIAIFATYFRVQDESNPEEV